MTMSNLWSTDFLETFIKWGLFYFLHSVLATTFLKQNLGTQFPRLYRISYNLISISILSYLVYILIPHLPIDSFKLSALSIIGAYLCAIGLFFLLQAFKAFDGKAFLGIRKEASTANLIRTGIYKHVRHPLYSGTLAFFAGVSIIFSIPQMFAILIVTILYIPIGIYLEEKKLVNVFGDTYRNYRKEVKALIPRVI